MTDLTIEYVAESNLLEANAPSRFPCDIPVARLEQVQAVLADKDQELERVKAQLDTLLGEAVWAMEQLASQAAGWQGELAVAHQRRTSAFLARPDVRERQARQKETT